MLSSETLIYTNFTDPRTKNRPGFVGGSGPLLMAEDTCGKKYIVKYQFPHVTANEYTASIYHGYKRPLARSFRATVTIK